MATKVPIKKRTAPNRAPPNRAQPAGPTGIRNTARKGTVNVVERLQELIQEKDAKIEKLTDRINQLSNQNKTLERKVENLQKAGASKPKPKPKADSGGISSGMSQGGAAAALAAKLGGHVKNKKMAEDKANASKGGGVSSGMNQSDAKNALAGLFGAKKSPPKPAPAKKKDEGGISTGMSQAGAAAALGGLFAKKKAPPKAAGGGGGAAKKSGGGGGADKYKSLFKKYEMMMKLGINVHGAVGRMRQDGVDKEAIRAFEKKHGALDDEDEKVDPASLGLKPKKEVKVSKGIKMKRFHWDPCDLKIVKGTIWENMDETSIRYDPKHFELHFQVRQRKPIDEEKDNKPKFEAGKIITFVSKKRTQAVLIGLKNLNLNNEQLRDVLHNMDEKVMNVDTLSKLLEMAPTMDEQTEAEKKIMQEGTRRAKDYGTVEQFFFALCDFYNLHQRLKLWMFVQNFHEICDSLQDQYKTIGKACDKLKSNKNLKLLLTIILAFGNHMNAGTRKGQTYGFDLKVLCAMTGVKSFDNTRSLLMYIYEFCDRKYPAAIKILPELTSTLKAASSMEVETLKQAYQRIQDNMKEIKNLITSDEIENYDLDDRFIMVLTKFHKKAQPKMKKFNMTVGNVMVSTKRVMKKFGYGTEEDPKSIESFFEIFYKFIQDFAAAKEKLIDLEKERQKRIAKRKREKEKANKKKMFEKYGKKQPPGKRLPGGAGGGNVDDDGPELQKGGALYKEFQKRQKFEQKKDGLHKKLGGHVKQRSIFIANGGKLEGQPQNDTMRRLSSMYQNDMNQIKAIDDARKAAAIKNYNKFRLPAINQQNKSRWDRTTSFGDKFEIPDDKPMMMPVGNKGRNGHQKNGSNKMVQAANNHKAKGASSPFQKSKPQYNAPKNNGGGYQIKPKQNGNNVPPPPSNGVPGPPPQQQHGAANTAAYPVYGNNPQNQWQQQAQLGYGSNPNLSYQQAQQYNKPAPNAYPQYQQKPRYNNPYRRQ